MPYFADWHTGLRAAPGAMFLLTASAHWGIGRMDLIGMVPRGIGSPGLWVTVTGFAEIAIAIGLQLPHLARWAAGIAILMLCGVFPANVKAAREHLTIIRRSVLSVGPRLVPQLVFIGASIAAVSSR